MWFKKVMNLFVGVELDTCNIALKLHAKEVKLASTSKPLLVIIVTKRCLKTTGNFIFLTVNQLFLKKKRTTAYRILYTHKNRTNYDVQCNVIKLCAH